MRRRVPGGSLRGLAALSLLAVGIAGSPCGCHSGGRNSAAEEGLRYYYEDIHRPFFSLEGGGLYRSRRPGSRPAAFAADKSSATLRVFLVGGSTVAGYDEGLLARGLGRLLPGRRVEVLNCGMSAYDTFREGMLVGELLRYSPDLLVLFSGHNDFSMNRVPPLPLWRLRLRRFMEGWGWWRALRAWRRARLPEGFGPGGDFFDARPPVEKIAELEANLRRTIRAAARGGVQVAVCSPPRSYRTAPLIRRPWISRTFVSGWLPALRGDRRAARAAWRPAIEGAEPSPAWLKPAALFFLGRAAERAGSLEESRRDLEQALDADHGRGGGYDLCTPACGALMGELARGEGALWIDLDAAFRAESWPRLPGMELFHDEFHWSREGDYLISAALVKALLEAPALAHWSWRREAFREVEGDWTREKARRPPEERRLNHSRAILYFAVQRIALRPELSWRAVEWLLALGEMEPAWLSSAERLRRETQATLRLRDRRSRNLPYRTPPVEVPEGRFRWHVGEARLRRGDYRGALRDLSEALRLDPSLGEAQLSLAMAAALAGEAAMARASLERAERSGLRPEAKTVAQVFLPEPVTGRRSERPGGADQRAPGRLGP